MMKPTDFDTIVIGSGSGGMTAALALAQAGQRVLICEQHELPGGWTHSFTLEGYRFSTGVHYIGELAEGGSLRKIYEGLGVSKDLEFLELNPDGFDHIFIGDTQFDIPKDIQKYIKRLKKQFPHEVKGIAKYFKLVSGINSLLQQLDNKKLKIKNLLVFPWFFRTGSDLINHCVSDSTLRAILAGQAGIHGLPPSQVPAVVQAGVVAHYSKGAFYPRGGGGAIPKAFIRAFKRAGGEIRLSTPVKRILIENKEAVGVELNENEMLFANNIISNADPETTFIKLIGEENLPRSLRRKVKRVSYSTSCLSLFLAVDLDLKTMGFDSGNYWFYDHDDLNLIYTQGLGDDILHNPPPALFLTITTLKDPSKMHDGKHTIEVFAFTGYDAFSKYVDQPTGDRSWEYQQLKAELTEKFLSVLEKRIPGFKEAVVFNELGTPVTNAHYLNAHKGNIYGIEKKLSQIGPLGFPIKSGINNLYLCGQSTNSHGIAETTKSGLRAAATILGRRKADLLTQNGPPLAIYPSDDIGQWPKHLQEKLFKK